MTTTLALQIRPTDHDRRSSSRIALVVIGIAAELGDHGSWSAGVIILIVVVGLGAFVWQQRGQIVSTHQDKCQLSTTFVGVHVNAPNGVQKCQQAKKVSSAKLGRRRRAQVVQERRDHR